jgi:MFS transporter, DHA3 family, macrolide efflux protein
MTGTSRSGVRAFFTIWTGQLVSLIGSGLTGFALAVWVYRETGSVTQFSLIALATTLPGILLAPLAGTLVDRWDRRKVMLLADTGSALCSLGIASLLYSDSLSVGAIVALTALSSSFESLQSPAFDAAVTLLVPRERLGNFNGLIQLGQAIPKVVSPVLAGLLVDRVGLGGVILIDFATYLVGVAATMLARVPMPPAAREDAVGAVSQSLRDEVTAGWRYLRANPTLLLVLLFFAVTYFSIGIVNVSGPALVLSFASAASLGSALSMAGVGFIAGSIAMSAWGGPRRRIYGVLGFTVPFGLGIALAGVYPSVPVVVAAILLVTVTAPLIFGSSQALWQAKVPAHLQGRVFALRDMVVRSALPLSYVVAGPLADRVFEPLMSAHGALAPTVGQVLGVGRGRGVALMFVIFGTLTMAAALGAMLSRRVRHVEDEVREETPSGATIFGAAAEVESA